MKIWIDDIRTPPDNLWLWAKDSKDALLCVDVLRLLNIPIEVVSFDHDLGGDDTTRPVVLWMCENEFWPDECRVHSANPVGIDWLRGMIQRYAPEGTLK